MPHYRLLIILLSYSYTSLVFSQTSDLMANYSRRTMSNIIVDSAVDFNKATAGIQIPSAILMQQKIITVQYYAFDNQLHQGQLIIHTDLVEDIQQIFALAIKIKFPINSVIPMSNIKFRQNNLWSDDLSMLANNTSAFNYRNAANSTKLSMHAYGRAIDINPMQNPYIKNQQILPHNANYNLKQKGTLNAKHPITQKFLKLGWTWGGNWQNVKDYQHFEK